jgi:hypothetical protein
MFNKLLMGCLLANLSEASSKIQPMPPLGIAEITRNAAFVKELLGHRTRSCLQRRSELARQKYAHCSKFGFARPLLVRDLVNEHPMTGDADIHVLVQHLPVNGCQCYQHLPAFCVTEFAYKKSPVDLAHPDVLPRISPPGSAAAARPL